MRGFRSRFRRLRTAQLPQYCWWRLRCTAGLYIVTIFTDFWRACAALFQLVFEHRSTANSPVSCSNLEYNNHSIHHRVVTFDLIALGFELLQFLLKACPHLFPKQDSLYPETATLYPETGILLPKTETKYPVSGYKVSVSGYKLSCFDNKCGQAFRNSHERVNDTLCWNEMW